MFGLVLHRRTAPLVLAGPGPFLILVKSSVPYSLSRYNHLKFIFVHHSARIKTITQMLLHIHCYTCIFWTEGMSWKHNFRFKIVFSSHNFSSKNECVINKLPFMLSYVPWWLATNIFFIVSGCWIFPMMSQRWILQLNIFFN